MSNGSSALALALGAGAGLGLWYLFGRDDDGKDGAKKTSAAPATSATAAPTSSHGATALPPMPCALRLDATGLTADGAAIDVKSAVARCQAAGRANLTIAGTAPGTVYADLVAAFGAAGITIQEHRNARSRARRQDGGALATLRTLAARARAAIATRQGSQRKEAAAKLARFVARHSGAAVNDDATIDFENNVVVNGTPEDMQKVAAWVARLARDTGRSVSATVELFDDPDDPGRDPDWAVCRIHGLGLEGT